MSYTPLLKQGMFDELTEDFPASCCQNKRGLWRMVFLVLYFLHAEQDNAANI